jgi:hypothetical protein
MQKSSVFLFASSLREQSVAHVEGACLAFLRTVVERPAWLLELMDEAQYDDVTMLLVLLLLEKHCADAELGAVTQWGFGRLLQHSGQHEHSLSVVARLVDRSWHSVRGSFLTLFQGKQRGFDVAVRVVRVILQGKKVNRGLSVDLLPIWLSLAVRNNSNTTLLSVLPLFYAADEEEPVGPLWDTILSSVGGLGLFCRVAGVLGARRWTQLITKPVSRAA